MEILISNLNKYGAAIAQEITCNGEPVSEVGEVGVNSISPCVSERPDLLRFTCDLVLGPVFYVP